ncbi:transcription factor tfiid complex subunit taf13 [Malassezia pachydermatis]|uniref:Transcription initiation factor TFIID subunit 13 n=1 Tax=Malassezia pachydermatis TaxID=77020 RepID=A0A0M8MRY5_9BASI|nr:transcription factor tfiid complex subunit taf13 [Malassezia pachydermatis]KOS13124.1 transcription factor tfiid complex subunit taf13 [Malassezia pachydermatis]
MYAYGDVANPLPESVAVLEEITVDFLTDLCLRAEPSLYTLGLSSSQLEASAAESFGEPVTSASLIGQTSAAQTYRHRAKLDDFKHALRHDYKKLGRLEQLLYADKMVQEARRIGGVEDVAASAGALVHGDPKTST